MHVLIRSSNGSHCILAFLLTHSLCSFLLMRVGNSHLLFCANVPFSTIYDLVVKIKCWCCSCPGLHISCLLCMADLSCFIKMEVWAAQISCCTKLTVHRHCHSSCGHGCITLIAQHALSSCFVTRSHLSFLFYSTCM